MKVYVVAINGKAAKIFLHFDKAKIYYLKLLENPGGPAHYEVKSFEVDMTHEASDNRVSVRGRRKKK